MRKPRRASALPAIAAMLALSGCYEYEQQPVAAQAPPAQGTGGTPAADRDSGASQARPGHAGARQAAQNTVDKVGERQRELEKALEDQD